jgi:acyl carrier protein
MTANLTHAEIESVLYTYLSTRFPHLGDCAPTTRLLDGGIDSLGVLELMSFLGDRFGFVVEDTDFEPENFETPAGLVQFIERKRAA